ncbi:DUF2971 domain-containing protein [Paenibacillus sp. NPDC058910]|uniref:DUF2971 domain-containing protein n=1 Tax=unclassified Paenibacillus TaxID=185978 RepID=UPI00368F244F
MWKKDYLKLMYPTNQEEMKMEEAMELKYLNIPDSLFKYRAFSQYSLENFINDEVRVTSANNFNDPFDCAHTLDFKKFVDQRMRQGLLNEIPTIIRTHKLEYSIDEVINNLRDKPFMEILKFGLSLDPAVNQDPGALDQFAITIEKTIEDVHYKKLIAIIDRVQRSTYVCCFSEVNDSTLMWSHYAENHSGFCLEYDFKQCGRKDILTRALQPVIYSNELFDMTPYFNTPGRYNNLVSTFSAISKSKEWEYEREWRLAFPIGEDFKPFNRHVPKPKGVYLGAKIKPDIKEKLMKIAEKKDINVFQMRLGNTNFQLTKEQII